VSAISSSPERGFGGSCGLPALLAFACFGIRRPTRPVFPDSTKLAKRCGGCKSFIVGYRRSWF
jgi:hypothetical protein